MITHHDEEKLTRAASIIARGGIIAFRTDTFYGLGVNPFNRDAILRIKDLKGRKEHKPILVIISDHDQIARFISETSQAFDLLAERFWPGPLTLIGKANAELPDEITAGTETVGVRLPDDDDVRALVRLCGGALTATSANRSGAEPARTAEDVRRYFDSSIDLIVDGGKARGERPSTVVDTRDAGPRLIREGVIAWAEIQETLDQIGAGSARPK